MNPGRGVRPSTGFVSIVDFGRAGLSFVGDVLGIAPVLLGPVLPFTDPGALTDPFGGEVGNLKFGDETDIDLGREPRPPLLVRSTGRNCGS